MNQNNTNDKATTDVTKNVAKDKSDKNDVINDAVETQKSKTNYQPNLDATFYPVRLLTVDSNSDGQRVDNYLRRILPNLPKSKLYKILRKGEVRVNKKRVKPEDKLCAGDEIRIPPITLDDKPTLFMPKRLIDDIGEMVLYQDDNYLVLNKPANIAVHSGTDNKFGIIDLIRQAFPDVRWELCHRLDKETSGCLLFANKREAQNQFNEQLKHGKVYKSYLTLVKGNWNANELEINQAIEKNSDNNFEKMRKTQNANAESVKNKKNNPTNSQTNEAISIFTTQENYSTSTLLKVVIKTGKTHQIRVHAANQGHFVAMDDKYGDFKWNKILEKQGLNRLFLHSHILRFTTFGQEIYVCAPLAAELQTFLDTQK